MKVFISWSGEASRETALVLGAWFPKVLQGVQTFVSAKDIDKGANWTVELARELEDTDFGVICLTPENLMSPWLNYEAGAITKSVQSRVCPILHGVDKSQVKPPIAQLQMTNVDLDEFKLLMRSMNKTTATPLDPQAVDEAVQVWWPQLEGEIGAVEVTPVSSVEKAPEPEKPESSVVEMLTEVLHRTRDLDRRMRGVERGYETNLATSIPNQVASPEDLIISALRREGISMKVATTTFGGIEVATVDPLPRPLPGKLYSALSRIAANTSGEVSVVGPPIVVKRDDDGRTDEPPF